ncbi:MAG: glycosyl hydrolase 53 family protein, partial [Bacilli bacterium]|nr:glycosyl hydrolase 53 family protein [Bacilli bacterium]
MKPFWQKAAALVVLPLLLSCSPSKMEEELLETTVYGETALPKMEGKITYSYEGKDIFVDEEKHAVSGTKANTETLLKISNGTQSKNLRVKVNNRPYETHHAEAEANEGWFEDIRLNPIPRKENFANGMDISSCKQLIDAGQRYYNEEGVEESLFRILLEHDVSWVRFRLWNDPYNHKNQDSPYGGGGGDLASTLWLAKQAKYFGLNVLLDLHYSDFWADPGCQVIPKAWAGLADSDQMAEAISSYTKQTLQAFSAIDALPDMVAIGNEVTGGMLLHLPG